MTSDTTPHPDLSAALDALHQSEQHLLRTVDSLSSDAWGEPSVLPGWTRAHVAAHLALNAEGLAGAVNGLAHDVEVPVYESSEKRDTDIEELSQAEPPEIRERLFGAGQALRDALSTLDEAHWAGSVARVPDGPRWSAVAVPETRRREVEIHHADLDLGYLPSAWPTDFSLRMVAQRQDELARLPEGGPSMVLSSTDVEGLWRFGSGHGPEVRAASGTSPGGSWDAVAAPGRSAPPAGSRSSAPGGDDRR